MPYRIFIIFVSCWLILNSCNEDNNALVVEKPTIQSVSKNQTFWGDTIILYGKNFGEPNEFAHLIYNDELIIHSFRCIKWNQILVKFIVPQNIHSGKFKIINQTDTSNSIYLTIKKRPEIEIVKMKSGNFIMGSSEGLPDEEPPHNVIISREFYISKYEITQQLWQLIMNYNPSITKESNHPVHNIKWLEAIRFCNALSKLDGLEQSYIISDSIVIWEQNANGWRLPTEAEWEYASGKFLYSGSNIADEVAWFSSNSANRTHPIGKKNPNEFGIFDMAGNVREWCWDTYKKDFYYNSNAIDPYYHEINGSKVSRGGGFCDGSNYLRRTARINNENPTCTGLRIVRYAE